MIREILVLHHSHTDIGFTHPQPVWWELSRRFIDEALDLCQTTENWPEESRMRWTCENTLPLINWLEQASPAQVERFRHFVQTGQVSVAALPCNLTMLPDLEQLARSLQPVDRLRSEFGLQVKSAIAHDVNGMPWPATQLLLDAGVELLLMGSNVHFGGFPLHRPMAFRWKGSDRRSLLSFNGEIYTYFDITARIFERSTAEMASGIEEYIQRLPEGYPLDFIYMTATHRPAQNDNNPPNPWLPEMIRRWNAEERQPKICLVTPEMLLTRLFTQPESALPEYSGDWTDYWTFGLGSAAFETRVGLRTRARLAAADLAGIVASHAQVADEKRLNEAYNWLTLWAEHTWQADASLTFPASDYAREQWAHKQSYLYQARSQVSLLLRDRLETLAGNPVHGDGFNGLLVFNPAPLNRKGFIRLPAGLNPLTWSHFSAAIMRLDSMLELAELGDGGLVVGPVEVPACGWTVLPVKSLEPAPVPLDSTTGSGWLQSPFHRLTFDPVDGRILTLVDRLTGWQAVDKSSPWDFAGLVRESNQEEPRNPNMVGRATFFDLDWVTLDRGANNWCPEWAAQRQKPERLLRLMVDIIPEGAVLTREWALGGISHCRQKITLQASQPVVVIETAFTLPERYTPEACYLTFPLNLPGWQAHFDAGELPVSYDREQLPGACRGWLAATHWLNMANAEFGITLANPDAPLFQVGGFNWAKVPLEMNAGDPAMVLAWLTNNYWNCNFPASQPGAVRFRYVLSTGGEYDPVKAALAGLEASMPLEIHPVLGSEIPSNGQIVDVKGEGLVLLHAGPTRDGVILRIANVGERSSQGVIILPGTRIQSAYLVDTFGKPLSTVIGEIDGDAARLIFPPRSARVVRLVTQNPSSVISLQ